MGWQTDAKRRGDRGLGQDGKPHQELSGVASLRFPQHPPGGTCPPPLEFPTLPGTSQTSVRRRQAMTCSQVLFFPLSLLRGWLQIASWNQAPSLHTGRPKQTRADGGSGKCCFTLGSFSALHQAQEAVRSLCFISTPPILTYSFLNEKGFREAGGTGKEVCSLLLLCEPSREKRHSGFTCGAFHLDIVGK